MYLELSLQLGWDYMTVWSQLQRELDKSKSAPRRKMTQAQNPNICMPVLFYSTFQLHICIFQIYKMFIHISGKPVFVFHKG